MQCMELLCLSFDSSSQAHRLGGVVVFAGDAAQPVSMARLALRASPGMEQLVVGAIFTNDQVGRAVIRPVLVDVMHLDRVRQEETHCPGGDEHMLGQVAPIGG